MRKIFKYPVDANSLRDSHLVIDIPMPRGAKPLCVMNQSGNICIWAEADPGLDDFDSVRFACIGTGHGKVPENGTYLGSVIDGSYVWHFYLLPNNA